MTLRKVTIDNLVRYIPKSEKTKEKGIEPETIKAGSMPRKQNKKISQNTKKFLENVAASEFGILTIKRIFTNIKLFILLFVYE